MSAGRDPGDRRGGPEDGDRNGCGRGRVVTRVGRREGDGKMLRRARVQDGAGGRHVLKCTGDVRGRVQLGRAERGAVDDIRGRDPGDRRGGPEDGDCNGCGRGRVVTRVGRREGDGEMLRRARVQDGAGGRRVLERAGDVRGRVQLRRAERGAVDDIRGRDPGDRLGLPDALPIYGCGRGRVVTRVGRREQNRQQLR